MIIMTHMSSPNPLPLPLLERLLILLASGSLACLSVPISFLVLAGHLFTSLLPPILFQRPQMRVGLPLQVASLAVAASTSGWLCSHRIH